MGLRSQIGLLDVSTAPPRISARSRDPATGLVLHGAAESNPLKSLRVRCRARGIFSARNLRGGALGGRVGPIDDLEAAARPGRQRPARGRAEHHALRGAAGGPTK